VPSIDRIQELVSHC